MKNHILKSVIILALLLSLLFLSACYSTREKKYYSERENYVDATGTITHIAYNEANDVLYLGFSELNPKFDDTSFKIVGKNLSIVQENGIDDKIAIGDTLEFISAPRYFGDGYVMPIVEVSVNGEELLEFEEGYSNLLEWLGAK